MDGKRFLDERLDETPLKKLTELSRLARGDILKMTTLAGSGHPGGSMSSIDFYLVLYAYANIHPQSSSDPNRDRIVISHGHTSPGVYAALGRTGFFPFEEFPVWNGILGIWDRDFQLEVDWPWGRRY
jgi:transketolase